MTVTVLLADDHTVVRQGLRALLETQQDIQVVGEATDGWEAVKLYGRLRPDVILMDIVMPELNGLGATKEICKRFPGAKVLALTSYGDLEEVRQMLEAGAVGYLNKTTAAEELCKAIHEVFGGHPAFSPAVAGRLRRQARRPGGSRGISGLTLRESQVLQLISAGKANKQIAAELGISPKTVEKHRQKVMDKLGIHDTASLTRYAVEREGTGRPLAPAGKA
jgi:DNA-binding NarL/FixJ family response regulator